MKNGTAKGYCVLPHEERWMQNLERKLTLPEGPFKAYLFDCDGTIVDSMPLHYVALKAVLAVLEHIHMSHGKIPFAVVSGSTRDSVIKSLETLGILDRFETLVCAGDYTKSKPDPEPFLIAAKRLGVAPQDCLVFEDTEMGIQAATAAGMASVKVLQPWEREKVPVG